MVRLNKIMSAALVLSVILSGCSTNKESLIGDKEGISSEEPTPKASDVKSSDVKAVPVPYIKKNVENEKSIPQITTPIDDRDNAKQVDWSALINSADPPKAKPSIKLSKEDKESAQFDKLGIKIVGKQQTYYDSYEGVTEVGISGNLVYADVMPEVVERPKLVEYFESIPEDEEEITPSSVDRTKPEDYPNSFAVGLFKITAYDLSFQATEKVPGDVAYGISKSGYSLIDKTRETAMTVAADLDVIPLGKKVYIKFEGPYANFSGLYTVRDKGGGVNGRHLDLFIGDMHSIEPSQEAANFGKRYAQVYLVE